MFDFQGTLTAFPRRNPLKQLVGLVRGESKQPIAPGMAAVIRQLAQSYQLSINSASKEKSIRAFLQQHDLEKYFETILDGSSDSSKAEKIGEYVLENGIASEQCLFITDTSDDISEAHSAGVPVVGVAWGYGDKDDLQKAEPEAVLAKPADLLDWLAEG